MASAGPNRACAASQAPAGQRFRGLTVMTSDCSVEAPPTSRRRRRRPSVRLVAVWVSICSVVVVHRARNRLPGGVTGWLQWRMRWFCQGGAQAPPSVGCTRGTAIPAPCAVAWWHMCQPCGGLAVHTPCGEGKVPQTPSALENHRPGSRSLYVFSFFVRWTCVATYSLWSACSGCVRW